jgi:putative NIF3 family GTP cyclohydrolase 1 type 2
VAGDPQQQVRRVAVCGGSGDGLFAEVRQAGADVYLTADLRHHPASEAQQAGQFSGCGPALVDAAHWATEWPWCEQAASQLDDISDRNGWALRTYVSRTVTDPWTAAAPQGLHAPTPTSSPGAPR